MKRVKGVIALLASILMLVGCGAQIPNMTEEETEVVTQYAANLLLKYDKNYESGIMSEDEMAKLLRRQITPTPVPQVEEPETEPEQKDEIAEDLIGGGTSEIVVDNRSMAEFFGLNGIDITYTGYSILDSYPESSDEAFYFAMDAVEGHKLLVLQFQVTNQSAEAQNVDVLNQAARFRVFINGGEQQNALTTLLTDDLKNMNVTLEAGATVSKVIVVEITEEEADSMQSAEELQLDMTIKIDGDALTLALVP